MASDDHDIVDDTVEDVDTDGKEASSSPSTFKEKMSVLKAKSKELGSAAGAKAKELAVQVSDATVEAAEVASAKTATFAKKAGRATKEAAVTTGSKSKALAAKAADATKEFAEKTAEATKEAADKTSLAVSAGIAVAKENLDDAKERRKAAKQATTVVVDPNEIVLGPDIEEFEDNHEVHEKGAPVSIETHTEAEVSEIQTTHPQYVIVPLDHDDLDEKPRSALTNTEILFLHAKQAAESALRFGPDLVIGWTFLFITLGTLANAIALFTEIDESVTSMLFGIPHFDLAFSGESVWIQLLAAGLLFLLLVDSMTLSFSPASKSMYKRLCYVVCLAWISPGLTGDFTNIITPFGTEDVPGVLWHLLFLPGMALLCIVRALGLPDRTLDSQHPFDSDNDGLSSGFLDEMLAPLSNNTDVFSELIPMGAQDDLMLKPGRRDKFDLYEKILLPLTLLLVFASVAMTIVAATQAEDSAGVLSSPWMAPIVMCLGFTLIFAVILMRMDKSARSGIDMAKRRERYNAMQDEFWETQRTKYRLHRESMEQGAHSIVTPSDA